MWKYKWNIGILRINCFLKVDGFMKVENEMEEFM